MVGVEVLEALALVDIPLRPLHWLSNIVGGLLFGVGMILSGGCSGSTWYRAGEGAIGAWVVLLGFAIGATTAGVGVLSPVRTLLQKPTLATADGGAPTLASLTGLPPWIVIAALALAGVVWLRRGPREPEHGKWPWPATGAAVGVMIAVGWWASAIGERPIGITFAANTGHLFTYPLVGYPNRVTWSMLMALGVPVGAFVAAWTTGQFGWKLPAPASLVKIFCRRPPDGRRGPRRRRLQHQPRPHQLRHARARQLARVRLDVRRRLRHAVVSLSAEDLTGALRSGGRVRAGGGGSRTTARSPSVTRSRVPNRGA